MYSWVINFTGGQLQIDTLSSDWKKFSLCVLTLCLAANVCHFVRFACSSAAQSSIHFGLTPTQNYWKRFQWNPRIPVNDVLYFATSNISLLHIKPKNLLILHFQILYSIRKHRILVRHHWLCISYISMHYHFAFTLYVAVTLWKSFKYLPYTWCMSRNRIFSKYCFKGNSSWSALPCLTPHHMILFIGRANFFSR